MYSIFRLLQLSGTSPFPESAAGQAQQFIADVRLPALGGRDPMPLSPRGIVPHMLLMSTLKVGNPIRMLIFVETNNFAGQALRLPW